MELSAYSIPAVVALLIKAGIYFYVRPLSLRSLQTRIFLLFLITLSLMNLSEISYFVTFDGVRPEMPPGGYLYFACSIVGLALILHLALLMARDWEPAQQVHMRWIYVPATILMALLWLTPWLVAGFEVRNYTYYRVAGPLYGVFEAYVLACCWAVIALFTYGALFHRSNTARVKNAMMLLGLVPMGLIVTSVILIQHMGVKLFNTTFTLPIMMNFFLVVAAYAIHQYRMFDVAFYIPWSTVRRRKTAFYRRIRTLVGEMASLQSVGQAIDRLADALQCPVALVTGSQAIMAAAGASPAMTRIPVQALRRFDHIVVAGELADSDPAGCELMRRHGVAAVVPFHPFSRNATGWLLLGETFSDNVYSPLDFRVVEELFDKMADLFLDRLLSMRSELATANRRLHALQQQHNTLRAEADQLRLQYQRLQELNRELARALPADSLDAAPAEQSTEATPTVTVLGRDAQLRNGLRAHFPQMQHFVGPASNAFRRHRAPEVVLYAPEPAATHADNARFARYLREHREQTAALLIGAHASDFLARHRATLEGCLIEVLPRERRTEALERRIRSLARLRRACFSLLEPDSPLLGIGGAFHRFATELERLAGFTDAVWLQTDDAGQVAAAGAFLHRAGKHAGPLVMVRTRHARRDSLQQRLAGPGGAVARAAGGVLVIDNLCALPPAVQGALAGQLKALDAPPRLVTGCPASPSQALAHGLCLPALAEQTRAFVLAAPALRDRPEDIPLLVHYFTLQYNLAGNRQHYLDQREAQELVDRERPASLAALRATVFERLSAPGPGSDNDDLPPAVVEAEAGSHTLEELLGAYEARLIAQALERCDQNKSKAARLLGLRPNTLHYKLERFGLSGKRRRGGRP